MRAESVLERMSVIFYHDDGVVRADVSLVENKGLFLGGSPFVVLFLVFAKLLMQHVHCFQHHLFFLVPFFFFALHGFQGSA